MIYIFFCILVNYCKFIYYGFMYIFFGMCKAAAVVQISDG